MLIDTHAHINDRRLLPLAEDIASSMQADNISHIINVGYDAESSEAKSASVWRISTKACLPP